MLSAFTAILCFLSYLFSIISGWSTIAKRYPSPKGVNGETFYFVAGLVTSSEIILKSWSSIFNRKQASLRITVNEDGFLISPIIKPPFIIYSIFIPWNQVINVNVVLYSKFYKISLKDESINILMKGEAGKYIGQMFTDNAKTNAS